MTLQELGELLTSPPAGITVVLADESDIFKWKVTMEGPADSPYAVSDWRFILSSTVSLLSKRPNRQSNIYVLLTTSRLQKQHLCPERPDSSPLEPRLGGNGLLLNPSSLHDASPPSLTAQPGREIPPPPQPSPPIPFPPPNSNLHHQNLSPKHLIGPLRNA
jgi:Ubiquitin-conjugating enzyme